MTLGELLARLNLTDIAAWKFFVVFFAASALVDYLRGFVGAAIRDYKNRKP